MTLKRTERMVNSAMALESMRDLGITLQQALTEMADNAIDAGCQHLAFHLDVRENGHLRIVVADDGIGVPMAHPSQPEVKQSSRVRWGAHPHRTAPSHRPLRFRAVPGHHLPDVADHRVLEDLRQPWPGDDGAPGPTMPC